MRRDFSETGSLELLLDTMCNTFGGVMFIAIALIIISSYIPKIIDDLPDEEVTAAQLGKMEDELRTLGAAVQKMSLQRYFDEKMIEKYRNSPRLPMLQELSSLKDENSSLEKEAMRLRAEQASLNLRIRLLEDERGKKLEELQDIKIKLEEAKSKQEKLKDEEERLRVEIELIKRDIACSKNRKKAVFSKLERTAKAPFFVIVDANELYPVSDGASETLAQFNPASGQKAFFINESAVSYTFIDSQHKIILSPKKGVCGGDFSDKSLDRIFSKLPRDRRFVWAMVKDDSFGAFVKIRDYLRDRNFEMFWYPVVDSSEYYLVITDKAEYEAQ